MKGLTATIGPERSTVANKIIYIVERCNRNNQYSPICAFDTAEKAYEFRDKRCEDYKAYGFSLSITTIGLN